nr:B3 domain-containing protein At2g31720-like [Quercus suber]
MSKHTDTDLRIDSLPPSENNDGVNAILTTEGVLKKFFLFHIKNSAHKQVFEQYFSSVCSYREANKRVSNRTKTIPPKKPDDNHAVTTTKPMPESKPTSSKRKRCSYEDNKEQEKGKNKKNNKRVRVQADPITPKLPTEFEKKVKGELKGSDVKLVIEKELSKTDMEKHQNRLLIPRAQVNVEFLTKEEKASLNEKDGNHYVGKKVPMIYWRTKELAAPLMEPRLDSSIIRLKNWKLGNKNALVLASPWTRIASENGLEIGNIIQLWSFRVKQELHMALVKL